MSSGAQAVSLWPSWSCIMYSPDMVTGGRVRLAVGGTEDTSTGDNFDWKHSLGLGSSNVNLVWAPAEYYCINPTDYIIWLTV